MFYLTMHSAHFIYGYMVLDSLQFIDYSFQLGGARCSSMVRVFAHGVMGCRINPLWCYNTIAISNFTKKDINLYDSIVEIW